MSIDHMRDAAKKMVSSWDQVAENQRSIAELKQQVEDLKKHLASVQETLVEVQRANLALSSRLARSHGLPLE